jgi:hypothetical protein
MRVQEQLAIQLLRPLCKPANADGKYAILKVREVAAEERNNVWHPEHVSATAYPFQNQTAVHPNLLAFCAFAALVIATIRSLDAVAIDSSLEAFVPTVEDWIDGIAAADPRTPEDASNIRMDWSRRQFAIDTRHVLETQVG